MTRRAFAPLITIFVCATSLAACAPASGQGPVRQQDVARISLADFKQAFDAGQVVTLDIRDENSYAAGHIPGALLFPLREVPQKAALLKGERKTIVAYCA